jgi:DNA-binding transcriptional ArsR family regulator
MQLHQAMPVSPAEEIDIYTENNVNIDYQKIRKSAAVLRALNHILRQQMIRIIKENNEITVTDLYVKLRLEQSVASQHLAILRQAGIVDTLRKGKCIYYSINVARIEAIQNFMNQLLA